ncbi:MAG TPA: ParB/RepB/Spo0J family partition protein, partial [Bryobacteraceae bacterium]|nr:ParB/RepB/Spo0J family partition protein [Bryobacteraceae bacterium]
MNKSTDPRRRALGKGLSALLPSRPQPPRTEPVPVAESAEIPASPGAPVQIPVQLIDPNPVQPRTVFEPERLAELAQSIRSNGIIQPLIVKRVGERFQLVAGERRWRAARLAELTAVPVVVQEVAEGHLLELALIENIQREDLNPIEVAHALERLGRELDLNHEQLGERTGKDRSTVTNLLRLLRLPAEVQVLVAEHKLSMGHARAILGLPTEELQTEVAEKAAAQGMSVRQVERLIRNLSARRDAALTAEQPPDPNVL